MEIMTLDEASKRFQTKRQTLYRAIVRGRLRAQRSGRFWLVTAADVGEWIAHGKHTPGPVSQPKPERPQRRPGRPRKQPTEDT